MTDHQTLHRAHDHAHDHPHGPACACGHDHAHEGALKRPVAPSLLAAGVGGRLVIVGVALATIWAATLWALGA